MTFFLNWTRDRIIAVAILASLLVLVALFLLAPLIAHSLSLREESNDLEFRLKRYLRIVHKRDEINANLEQIRQQYGQMAYLMRHDNPAVAAAQLQQVIKDAIASVNAQLTSTQVLPPRPDGEFTRVGVKVRMTANIEGVRAIVHELEQSEPIYLVQELDIRPRSSVRNRRTGKIEASNQLNVSFEAIGFMLPGGE